VQHGAQRALAKADPAEQAAADLGLAYVRLDQRLVAEAVALTGGDLEERLEARFGQVAAHPQRLVEVGDRGRDLLFVRGDRRQQRERLVVATASRCQVAVRRAGEVLEARGSEAHLGHPLAQHRDQLRPQAALQLVDLVVHAGGGVDRDVQVEQPRCGRQLERAQHGGPLERQLDLLVGRWKDRAAVGPRRDRRCAAGATVLPVGRTRLGAGGDPGRRRARAAAGPKAQGEHARERAGGVGSHVEGAETIVHEEARSQQSDSRVLVQSAFDSTGALGSMGHQSPGSYSASRLARDCS
jgi:hypothetical protein